MHEVPLSIMLLFGAIMSVLGYNITFEAIKCYTSHNERVWLRRILLVTAFIPVANLITILVVGLCEIVVYMISSNLKDFNKYWGKQ